MQLSVNAQIQLGLYLNFRPQCLHHPPEYQLPICKSIAFLPPHVKNDKYNKNANTVGQSTIANPEPPTRVPQLPTCKNIVFLPPPPRSDKWIRCKKLPKTIPLFVPRMSPCHRGPLVIFLSVWFCFHKVQISFFPINSSSISIFCKSDLTSTHVQ